MDAIHRKEYVLILFFLSSFSELTEPGYAVLAINATDADLGSNSRIRYSLALSPTDAFYIIEDTGMIYTNRTLTFNPRQPVLQLVVKAEDSGRPSLSSVVAVRIQIADVNNNAPKFSQDVYTYVFLVILCWKTSDQFQCIA